MQTYPITRLKHLSYPRFMIFFDTETNQKAKQEKTQAHEFRLGVAIYVELNQNYSLVKREVFYFNRIGDFWRFVLEKTAIDRVLYIYAHNLKYDLMSVQFERGLPAMGFTASFPILGHNFIMSATKGKRKINFHDSFNYFKVRLKTMGRAVNQPKIRLKHTCTIRTKTEYQFPPIRLKKFSTYEIYFNRIDDKILYPYCQNDVEIVEKIMLKFIEFLRKDKLGSLEPTAASTALNVFRTKFNRDESIHYHKDLELLKFERSAYKGGRVECFYIGSKKEDFYLYDVNSMYPYIMANFELPVKPLIMAERMSFNEALSYSESHYLIAECVLSYKSNIGYYGTHHDHKLLFPIGHFKTTLHNPEIIRGIEKGHILSLGKTVIYEKKKALSDYANFFYNVRLNSTDVTYNTLSKLMNNSLYGRFGMSSYDKEILGWDLEELDTDKLKYDERLNENALGVVMIQQVVNGRKIWTPYYKWYGQLIHSTRDELTPKKDTNIALAGAVTAYGRMLLLDYIIQAGHRNAYYGDTDSILVNKAGSERLNDQVDSKKLGSIKLEMQCSNIRISAPKDYQFGNKQRLKGVPSNFTFEDGSYSFIRFTTLRDYLKNGGTFFGTKDENKILTHNYNKGIIGDDGFTRPIELQEFS